MRTLHLLAATSAWTLSAACGPASTDAPAPATGSATEEPTSSAPTGTGGSGGAGGSGGTNGMTGDGTGGAAVTTGTGGETTGTGGATTSAGEPLLRAFHVDGLYSTVRVFKADLMNDRCTIVRFTILGAGDDDDPSYAAVARPEGWGVEYVLITKGFADCHDFNLAVENELEGAISASGAATWQGWPPETLDIDVTITFAADAAWVPAEDTVSAASLVVEPG